MVVSTCLTLLTSVSVFVFASSIVDSSKKLKGSEQSWFCVEQTVIMHIVLFYE